VPLIARGPGIAAGSSVGEIVLNIDLFPTIAELAGVSAPPFVDGLSMTPLLTGRNNGWRNVALIEGFGKETESNEGGEPSTPAFRALRSDAILYAEYETGERELYILRKDPYELSNIARQAPKSLLRQYSRSLNALAACAGSECARLEDDLIPRRSTWATEKQRGKEKNTSQSNRRVKKKDKETARH